jgi:hypothetical protein
MRECKTERNAEIVRRREEGATFVQIGFEFGISDTVAQRIYVRATGKKRVRKKGQPKVRSAGECWTIPKLRAEPLPPPVSAFGRVSCLSLTDRMRMSTNAARAAQAEPHIRAIGSGGPSVGAPWPS